MISPLSFSKDDQLYAGYIDRIGNWHLENQDAILKVYVPGVWPASTTIEFFKIKCNPNFCISIYGYFLRARILN